MIKLFPNTQPLFPPQQFKPGLVAGATDILHRQMMAVASPLNLSLMTAAPDGFATLNHGCSMDSLEWKPTGYSGISLRLC